jgi:four helix bundle protein
MRIFEMSKHWPVDERYALSAQIRRSSRAVCANITEAWRKRRYEPGFVSKLSEADAEAAETQTWLDFALACGYINPERHPGAALRPSAKSLPITPPATMIPPRQA